MRIKKFPHPCLDQIRELARYNYEGLFLVQFQAPKYFSRENPAIIYSSLAINDGQGEIVADLE
jgi:hypothetical protein